MVSDSLAVPGPLKPLIAIRATAGTGSETTEIGRFLIETPAKVVSVSSSEPNLVF